MGKKKILVIDDEILLLESTKMQLEMNGYDVIATDNAKDGILKAMSEKPDLIISDIMMPEINGIEMTKVIRSNSSLKGIPIIMLSALGRESDVKEAMEAGATDYFIKPYEIDMFLKKIKQLLGS